MNRAALQRVLEETNASRTFTLKGSTFPQPTDSELATAYRRYWTMPETEPLETFLATYLEIVRLEPLVDPRVAWRTLREAATDYYTETGICPFCRERGDLHLPAEELAMELGAEE